MTVLGYTKKRNIAKAKGLSSGMTSKYVWGKNKKKAKKNKRQYLKNLDKASEQ
jgi:hypothetical protein